MFLINLGYKWSMPSSIRDLEGGIYLPSGNNRVRLERAGSTEFRKLLLDPQLYLAGLDPQESGKFCARLATFPWFAAKDVPVFDEKAGGVRDWETAIRERIQDIWPKKIPEGGTILKACRSALEFQLRLGCTDVILPSPLITDREDEAQLQAEWLDKSLEAAEELDVAQPMLATVALRDTALNDDVFTPAGFIDTVVDQITSRKGLGGVYIVILQSNDAHPFFTVPRSCRAYMHLSRVFGARGYDSVLVNFADVLSLACIGVGATSMGWGASYQLRRLAPPNLMDEGGGIALPRYYSHRSVGEFLTEKDLNDISLKKLLGRVKDDTTFSKPLMEALAHGRTAAELPAWAESKSNIAEANKHFVARLLAEERRLGGLSPDERLEAVRVWLEDAAANSLFIRERLGKKDIGNIAPTVTWIEQLDQVTDA